MLLWLSVLIMFLVVEVQCVVIVGLVGCGCCEGCDWVGGVVDVGGVVGDVFCVWVVLVVRVSESEVRIEWVRFVMKEFFWEGGVWGLFGDGYVVLWEGDVVV